MTHPYKSTSPNRTNAGCDPHVGHKLGGKTGLQTDFQGDPTSCQPPRLGRGKEVWRGGCKTPNTGTIEARTPPRLQFDHRNGELRRFLAVIANLRNMAAGFYCSPKTVKIRGLSPEFDYRRPRSVIIEQYSPYWINPEEQWTIQYSTAGYTQF